MKDNQQKATWKETIQLHCRCVKEMYNLFPNRIRSMILHDFFFSCHPYVTVYLTARIINELAGLRRSSVLWTWIIITLLVEAIVAVIRHILHNWEYKEWHYSRRAQDKVLISKKMMLMDYAEVEQQRTHDLLAQIEQYERSGNWGIGRALYFMDVLFSAFVGVVGAVALLISLFCIPVPEDAGAWIVLNNPIMMIAFLIVLLFTIAMSALTEIKAVRRWSEANYDMRYANRCFRVYGTFCADFKKAMDIRIYNQQDIVKRYLDNEETYGAKSRLAKVERGSIGVNSGVSELLSSLFNGIAYLFVGVKSWTGAFGVGSVMQYVGALNTLSYHVSRLIQAIGNMRSNTPFLRTTYDFLDIPNNTYCESEYSKKIKEGDHVIEFRNVSFKYPNSSNWSLRHVNATLKSGHRIAIVGRNGSGKTTFIKLLCRLYEPDEGEILLDGVDIREYDRQEYMSIVSVVFQDFNLLAQSIGSNVSGQSNYEPERAIKALADAGFLDKLDKLPNGLETVIYKEYEDSGVNLSGGEEQKIAIGRAMYKNSEFMVLDEPTAALDPLAEAEIYARINEISENRATIFISHRLSSCKFCDSILVFFEGSIVQSGKHCDLVKNKNEEYYCLWSSQAQYYH